MKLLMSSIIVPKIQLQYIRDSNKIFRVISESIDPLFKQLLSDKSIRVQVWLEREVRKLSNSRIKRSWVHSCDMSNKRPTKLFTNGEYNYGGGNGWGWKGNDVPSYTTTNGIVPTEFEVTLSDIQNDLLVIKFPVVDIFSNILKKKKSGTSAKDGDLIEDLAIISRGRATYQIIRAKLVVNYAGKVIMSEPSNSIMLGIHRKKDAVFDSKNLESFIKIGRFI